jgi:hypothetical protein
MAEYYESDSRIRYQELLTDYNKKVREKQYWRAVRIFRKPWTGISAELSVFIRKVYALRSGGRKNFLSLRKGSAHRIAIVFRGRSSADRKLSFTHAPPLLPLGKLVHSRA